MDLTEEEYQAKKNEVISRFTSDFIENYAKYDPTTNHIIECLIRDVNPYVLIEHLIERHKENVKRMHEIIAYSPMFPIMTKKPDQ